MRQKDDTKIQRSIEKSEGFLKNQQQKLANRAGIHEIFYDFLTIIDGTAHFQNVSNCLNTNIYSYLETSDGQSCILD